MLFFYYLLGILVLLLLTIEYSFVIFGSLQILDR